MLLHSPSTFFFLCFLILYFLIHPFLSIDSLTVSSETFWSPHRSPSVFISKHPNFFLGPPHPQAACREGSALRGPWVGQEAAGGGPQAERSGSSPGLPRGPSERRERPSPVSS